MNLNSFSFVLITLLFIVEKVKLTARCKWNRILSYYTIPRNKEMY